MRDRRLWKGAMVEYGNQSITCILFSVDQDLTLFRKVVYASYDRNEKMELWEELGAMRNLYDGPWVVCGDSNTTRFP